MVSHMHNATNYDDAMSRLSNLFTLHPINPFLSTLKHLIVAFLKGGLHVASRTLQGSAK